MNEDYRLEKDPSDSNPGDRCDYCCARARDLFCDAKVWR